jgi:hypothetical protein
MRPEEDDELFKKNGGVDDCPFHCPSNKADKLAKRLKIRTF